MPKPDFFICNRLVFSIPLPYDYKNYAMFNFFLTAKVAKKAQSSQSFVNLVRPLCPLWLK